MNISSQLQGLQQVTVQRDSVKEVSKTAPLDRLQGATVPIAEKTIEKEQPKVEQRDKQAEGLTKLRSEAGELNQNIKQIEQKLQEIPKQELTKLVKPSDAQPDEQTKTLLSSKQEEKEGTTIKTVRSLTSSGDISQEGIEQQQASEKAEDVLEDTLEEDSTEITAGEEKETQADEAAGQEEKKKVEKKEDPKSKSTSEDLAQKIMETQQEAETKEDQVEDEETEDSNEITGEEATETKADEAAGEQEQKKVEKKEDPKSKNISEIKLHKPAENTQGDSDKKEEKSPERLELNKAIDGFKNGNSKSLEQICIPLAKKGNKDAADGLVIMALENAKKGDTKLLIQIAYDVIKLPTESKDKMLAMELKRAIETGDLSVVSKLKPQAVKEITTFHKAVEGEPQALQGLQRMYPDVAQKVEQFHKQPEPEKKVIETQQDAQPEAEKSVIYKKIKTKQTELFKDPESTKINTQISFTKSLRNDFLLKYEKLASVNDISGLSKLCCEMEKSFSPTSDKGKIAKDYESIDLKILGDKKSSISELLNKQIKNLEVQRLSPIKKEFQQVIDSPLASKQDKEIAQLKIDILNGKASRMFDEISWLEDQIQNLKVEKFKTPNLDASSKLLMEKEELVKEKDRLFPGQTVQQIEDQIKEKISKNQPNTPNEYRLVDIAERITEIDKTLDRDKNISGYVDKLQSKRLELGTILEGVKDIKPENIESLYKTKEIFVKQIPELRQELVLIKQQVESVSQELQEVKAKIKEVFPAFPDKHLQAKNEELVTKKNNLEGKEKEIIKTKIPQLIEKGLELDIKLIKNIDTLLGKDEIKEVRTQLKDYLSANNKICLPFNLSETEKKQFESAIDTLDLSILFHFAKEGDSQIQFWRGGVDGIESIRGSVIATGDPEGRTNILNIAIADKYPLEEVIGDTKHEEGHLFENIKSSLDGEEKTSLLKGLWQELSRYLTDKPQMEKTTLNYSFTDPKYNSLSLTVDDALLIPSSPKELKSLLERASKEPPDDTAKKLLEQHYKFGDSSNWKQLAETIKDEPPKENRLVLYDLGTSSIRGDNYDARLYLHPNEACPSPEQLKAILAIAIRDPKTITVNDSDFKKAKEFITNNIIGKIDNEPLKEQINIIVWNAEKYLSDHKFGSERWAEEHREMNTQGDRASVRPSYDTAPGIILNESKRNTI